MSEFNFYRHCWLTLKNSKPRLRKFMDLIEIEVEQASKFAEPKKPNQKEEPANADNADTEAPYVQV